MRFLLKSLFAGVLIAFSVATFAQMIDINTATADQLDKGLKGIGPKKGAEIVKYRETNGPFKSVDDLAKVPGIKGKTLNQIKPLVTVGGAEPAAATSVAPTMPAMPAMPTKPAVPTTPVIPPTAPKQ